MQRYDATSPESIFDYSKGLINKSLYEAVILFNPNIKKDDMRISGKGGLGQLVEKFYYEYEPNSDPTADFAEAGVELKTTPLKCSMEKKEELAIKERLVCDMIDFCAIVNIKFEDSPFYRKCILMLILFYLHDKDVDKCDLKFLYSVLWRLQGKDLEIIRHDYELIVEKIRQGKAHELSEGDTMYLAACRKGQKGDPLRQQPFSDKGAPKRAFSLKTAYMRTVLDEVKKSGKAMVTNSEYKVPSMELVSASDLKEKPFEQIITDRLMCFKGKDYKQIANMYGMELNPGEKSLYNHITRLMLHKGLKAFEDAEEIKKAGITVKTIRLQKNVKINESMSFKNVVYEEVVEADSFYDSEWYDIVTGRFLFVVYRETDVPKGKQKLWEGETRYVLDRVVFWTMPEEDMPTAEAYWENIRENVLADRHYTEKGNTYWRLSDNNKFHVRPKGANAASMMPTPVSGRMVKKVCYWFNAEYVKEILRRDYGADWKTE